MRSALAVLVLLAGTLLSTAVAVAAGSREGEGFRLRLAAAEPGPDGRFRAAILVDLEPGWKTYWLEPGEAGLPPTFEFSGAGGVEAIDTYFPAPHRFDDGFSKSIVYSEPFAIAVEGRLRDPSAPGPLELRMTLGLCRDVCVPVKIELDANFGAKVDAGAVETAFAALPKPSTADRGILGGVLSPDGRTLDLSVGDADAADAELFVAGPSGWTFGVPAAAARSEETAMVRVPVLRRPRRAQSVPLVVDVILAGPAGAWRADKLAVAAGR